jgi:4,5-dihydroxyphthalate decarboxylase
MNDPLPYGLAPNVDILNHLMEQVVAQGIIDAPIALEDLFAPQTHNLVG